MMAIEYTDMIKRMMTTVIATAPMFLTISVMVNSMPDEDPAAGLGVCKRNRRKPIAFVPRMVVKIVTVTPPKSFDYIDNLPAVHTERWSALGFPGEPSAPAYLLRNKVVDNHAVDLHGLSRKFRRRKFRCPRGRDRSSLQQGMA